MGLISALKILVVIVVFLLFILVAYKTLKDSSGMKAFIYVFIEFFIFAGLAFGVQWMVTQSFIKVELRNFHNTPVPSSEKLSVKGCVRNIGNYKASTVTLHIKVVNNASGGSFGSASDKPQKLELKTVVAKNLAKGIQRCFNKRFKYPPYFRLANIRAHISAN